MVITPSIDTGLYTLANPTTTQTTGCVGPATLTAVQVKAFTQN